MFGNLPLGEVVDARSAEYPRHLDINGRRVSLVPISTLHAPILYQRLCQKSPKETWAYMSSGPFETQESFNSHIQNMATSADPLFFTVMTRTDLPGIVSGTPVGYLSLMRIETKNRSIEIGNVTFSAALQRTTVATEALYLAMRHCFDDLANRRLEWKCDSLNTKSRRAAGRLGFVFEGIFRKHLIVRARSRDTAWFSIVEDEWPRVKEALEIWLDESNFDETGEQRRGLVDIRQDAEAGSKS